MYDPSGKEMPLVLSCISLKTFAKQCNVTNHIQHKQMICIINETGCIWKMVV